MADRIWVLQAGEDYAPAHLLGVFSEPRLAMAVLDAEVLRYADYTELSAHRIDSTDNEPSFSRSRGDDKWVAFGVDADTKIDSGLEYMLSRCSNWPPSESVNAGVQLSWSEHSGTHTRHAQVRVLARPPLTSGASSQAPP